MQSIGEKRRSHCLLREFLCLVIFVLSSCTHNKSFYDQETICDEIEITTVKQILPDSQIVICSLNHLIPKNESITDCTPLLDIAPSPFCYTTHINFISSIDDTLIFDIYVNERLLSYVFKIPIVRGKYQLRFIGTKLLYHGVYFVKLKFSKVNQEITRPVVFPGKYIIQE